LPYFGWCPRSKVDQSKLPTVSNGYSDDTPVGAGGLLGTKGFIAPEVLHVGMRKLCSVYDHKADIFSFGMLLYQMIARRHPYHDTVPHQIHAAVESGERPKLQDVDVANTGYHYLTQLMQMCWEDNPQNRPTTDDIIDQICQSLMQAVMCVHPVKSRYSLRKICAITSHDFTQAGVTHGHSELWVCCDGAEGTEVNIYNTNLMVKISQNFIKESLIFPSSFKDHSSDSCYPVQNWIIASRRIFPA